MNSTVQVRIDTKTKRDAQIVLERLGLDISSGVKVFLRQVVETNSLPFPVRTANGFTSVYEQALVAERAKLRKSKSSKHVAKSTRRLFADLGVS